MSTEEMVVKARELCRLMHEGQPDTLGRSRYAYLDELAGECYFDEMKTVAYLQSGPEQRPDLVSVEEIRRRFGDEIGDAVDAMTRRPLESAEDHYARLKQNPLALGVKMKDLRRRIGEIEAEGGEDPSRSCRLGACRSSLEYFAG